MRTDDTHATGRKSSGDLPTPEKKTWRRPTLTTYGDIRKITQRIVGKGAQDNNWGQWGKWFKT
ncbi:MAG: hypothetical protein GY731_20095 [Gammaproteobacteria bacterium]|nr:hypothetical protein [Gammaproteobacteria bacterium]